VIKLPVGRLEKILLARRRSRVSLLSTEHARYARELRIAFSKIVDASDPSSSWHANVRELQRWVSSSDPYSFLRWGVIRKTMFVGWSAYVIKELRELAHDLGWHERWRSLIREDNAGLPGRFPLHWSSSGNRIHHAYHLLRFERATKRSLGDFGWVVEFGGGYGSMCRLISKAGFRGRYIIYDLPHFSALQRYYLLCCGGTEISAQGGPADSVSLGQCVVTFMSDAQRFREALESRNFGNNGLFVATWSLSEAPLAQRVVGEHALRSASAALIAYQEQFDGVDNRAYFTDVARFRKDLDWRWEEIAHLPSSHYLFAHQHAVKNVT
jgi:hypothetical protein